jgi:hypothetical protein
MPPLRMPHHATLCSSCLNCQSNFRLKVLPPSRVIRETQPFQHLYHYCVSAVTALCFSISSSSVSALCFCTCDPTFVFQHSCSSICVLASMFQHLLCVLHNQPIAINDNLDHLRQLLCSSSVSALCFSICVPAFVFQHLCFSIYVLASMFQHVLALCFSICVPTFVFHHLCFSICVLASMFQHLLCVLHKQSIALNDNLDHLHHLYSTLTICVIVAIAILPTLSLCGIWI